MKDAVNYEKNYVKYNSLIQQYDYIVNQYNKLASKAYKRFYLIPIPGHHHTIHH